MVHLSSVVVYRPLTFLFQDLLKNAFFLSMIGKCFHQRRLKVTLQICHSCQTGQTLLSRCCQYEFTGLDFFDTHCWLNGGSIWYTQDSWAYCSWNSLNNRRQRYFFLFYILHKPQGVLKNKPCLSLFNLKIIYLGLGVKGCLCFNHTLIFIVNFFLLVWRFFSF